MENENELNNTMKELIKELKTFNIGFKLIFTNALVKSKLMETFNNTKSNIVKPKSNSFIDTVIPNDHIDIKLKRVKNHA